MLWNKLKGFFKEKSGATMVAAALSSQVAYGHVEPKVEDAKQDTTEQVVIQKGVDGKYEFMTINGNPIRGSLSDNLKANRKDYIQEQKELFAEAPENFVQEVSVENVFQLKDLASYNSQTKNIRFYEFNVSKEELTDLYQQRFPSANKQELQEKVETSYAYMQQANDKSSPTYQSLAAHEYQHMVNDKSNFMAPGLSLQQYAKLNQYDEVSAFLSQALLLKKLYEDERNQGKTHDDACKIFDSKANMYLSFCKDIFKNKENFSEDEVLQQMVQGACRTWDQVYKEDYIPQTKSWVDDCPSKPEYDVASLAIGNKQEFEKRVKMLFDSYDKNPILKQHGISVGKLSKYFPKEGISLPQEIENHIEDLSLTYTGMTPNMAKDLSERMPGSQKEDVRNLLKVLSGRSVPKKVQSCFKFKNEVRDYSFLKKQNDGR